MNISTLPKYKTLGRLSLLTIICLFSTLFCNAQYGKLDVSFGTGGKVTGGINGFDNYAYSVAVQPDGKILVGGEISYDKGSTYTRELLISRYNIDGSLDLTFGNGGMDTTDFPQAGNGGCSIAIQADGKIVVAGYSGIANLTLLRYNSNGQLDARFGQNGIAVYNIEFEPSLGPPQLKVMPDGSIIVSGTGFAGIGSGWDFMLMRCDSVGVLDGSFGTYGYVCTNFNNNNSYCVSMAVQCDGKIVAVGSSTASPSGNALVFTILRYNADGSLDNSFGRNGVVHTNFANTSESIATCVGLHSDGRITVAGYLEQGRFSYGIAQYQIDGSPDTSFGNGGLIAANFPSGGGMPYSMIIQPDERILIGGQSGGGAFAMARFNIDGSLDNTFGENGYAENYFGSGTGLAMQADGKILQTGSSTQLPFKTILARYTSGLSNGPIDDCQYPSFPFTEAPAGLIRVLPNPSNGNITLQFSLPEKENANIELYDVLGQSMMTSTMELNAGISYYNRIDFSSLPRGDYTMRVQLGSQTYIRKLVKTE